MFVETKIEEREQIAFITHGLTARHATLDDVAAATELFNLCSLDQLGVVEFTEDDIRSEWQTPDFDPQESIRLVETAAGQLVGYVEVWDIAPLPVMNWVWGRVHPDFEGLGIGAYLMRWAETRLQRTLARVPDDLRVVMRSSHLSTHEPSRRLMEKVRMQPVRHFWRMVIDLDEDVPAPAWPPNIRLRTFAEVNDLRATYRAMDDSFRDHWGHVDQEEEQMLQQWQHWMETDEQIDPRYWFLAMDGDEIAAVCLCRLESHDDPQMGWVNTLGVRRPWRRQGLALALLHHTFRAFQAIGRERVGLGVDAGSLTGATRLYEKAGMHVARQYDSYEKVIRPGRDVSTQSLDA